MWFDIADVLWCNCSLQNKQVLSNKDLKNIYFIKLSHRRQEKMEMSGIGRLRCLLVGEGLEDGNLCRWLIEHHLSLVPRWKKWAQKKIYTIRYPPFMLVGSRLISIHIMTVFSKKVKVIHKLVETVYRVDKPKSNLKRSKQQGVM